MGLWTPRGPQSDLLVLFSSFVNQEFVLKMLAELIFFLLGFKGASTAKVNLHPLAELKEGHLKYILV